MLTTYISIQVFIITYIATQAFINRNAIKFLLNNVSSIRMEYIPTYPVKHSDIRFKVDICNKHYSYMYSSYKKYFTIPTKVIDGNFVRVMVIETNGELDTDAIEKLSYRLLKLKKFLLVFIHENRVIVTNLYNAYHAKLYTYADYKNYKDTLYTQSVFKDILDYLGYEFKEEEKSSFIKLADLVQNNIQLEESKYYCININPPSCFDGTIHEWHKVCIETMLNNINSGEFIIDECKNYNFNHFCDNEMKFKDNEFILYGFVYDGKSSEYFTYIRKSDGRVFLSKVKDFGIYCVKLNDKNNEYICNGGRGGSSNGYICNGGSGGSSNVIYTYNTELDKKDKPKYLKLDNKYNLAYLFDHVGKLDSDTIYFTKDTKEIYRLMDGVLTKVYSDYRILEEIAQNVSLNKYYLDDLK